jgi:hypothetical protein
MMQAQSAVWFAYLACPQRMRSALVMGLCRWALRRSRFCARRRLLIGEPHDKKEAAGIAAETRAQIDL